MDSDPPTEELRLTQADRERAERRLAEEAPVKEETAQHERRADKARYLQEKLAERAESEAEAKREDPAEAKREARRDDSTEAKRDDSTEDSDAESG